MSNQHQIEGNKIKQNRIDLETLTLKLKAAATFMRIHLSILRPSLRGSLHPPSLSLSLLDSFHFIEDPSLHPPSLPPRIPPSSVSLSLLDSFFLPPSAIAASFNMTKRTATTNSLLLLINAKAKRIKTAEKFTGVYLSDECWELIFKNLLMDDQHYNTLSLVSKQFLSITNRLRSSLTIKSNLTTEQALNLIRRFPKLTSLDFSGRRDLDYFLPRLSTFPFRLTSLKLDKISPFLLLAY
ncbi:F-box/LRR protein [Trifolium pratense]|uniref:F-box/LRR protein n=1 Tax=Trifolium pratense TaxID=57577 RepID=A0A2K3N7S5_TRIPR|nr:F-box/LRR protein [Trifolium pratense]